MWTKKSIGDTAVESVNAGISSGVIVIPDEVYEYTLSESETTALMTGLSGSAVFSISLGMDYEEAFKHPAIRIVANTLVDETPLKLESLLVEVAQAILDDEIAQVSYKAIDAMALGEGTAFNLDISVDDGSAVLYGQVASSGGATKYKHICQVHKGVTTGATAPYVNFIIEIINESANNLTEDDIKSYLGDKTIVCNGFGATGDKIFGMVRCGVTSNSIWAQAYYTQASFANDAVSFSKLGGTQGLQGNFAIDEQVVFEI